MRPARVVALVAGCLLLLPGLAMLFGGSVLGLAYAFGRDDGYFEADLDRLQSPTAAITTEDIDLGADKDADWLLDRLDVDIRLQVAPVDPADGLFVGIGSADDVAAYLGDVARDEITDVDGLTPEYERFPGAADAEPPTDQDFWAASVSGTGALELRWEATSGEWTVVLMRADGSPGVAADVDAGAKAGFVLPLALILIGLGVLVTAGAVALIISASRGHRADQIPAVVAGAEPPPPAGAVPLAGPPVAPEPEPVALHASLDPELSPWKWLVKWILVIPHFVVLALLWMAFMVSTFIAGFSILFTRTYPRGLFDFNVGVLRWSWRVTYYAGPGGLGTDRYPPFSLSDDPTYPARLDIAYPGELSQGLVLVKWWLLAIPHYLVVAVLIGSGIVWTADGEGVFAMGFLGVLTLIAAVALLFTGRYPGTLFDLIIGFDRWVVRVIAYAALMTDRYPPFRLDQGGDEPTGSPDGTDDEVTDLGSQHADRESAGDVEG